MLCYVVLCCCVVFMLLCYVISLSRNAIHCLGMSCEACSEYCMYRRQSRLVGRRLCLMLRSGKSVVSEYRSANVEGGDVMRGLKMNWDLGLFTLLFCSRISTLW